MDTSSGITCACKPGYTPDDSPVACKLGSCYVEPVTCGFSHGFPVGPSCCPDPAAPTGYTCTCPAGDGQGGSGGGNGTGSDKPGASPSEPAGGCSSGTGSDKPGASPSEPAGGCSSGPGAAGRALAFVVLGLGRRRTT
jgi:hypothetical protein